MVREPLVKATVNGGLEFKVCGASGDSCSGWSVSTERLTFRLIFTCSSPVFLVNVISDPLTAILKSFRVIGTALFLPAFSPAISSLRNCSDEKVFNGCTRFHSERVAGFVTTCKERV